MTEPYNGKERAAARGENWLQRKFAEEREIAGVRAAAHEFERNMGSTIVSLEKEIARLEAIISGASIPERRAVSVSTSIDGRSRRTAVVCNDGSMWGLNHEAEYEGWRRMPGIPQPVHEMEKQNHSDAENQTHGE